MQYSKQLVAAAILSVSALTGCSKSDDNTPASSIVDAYVQIDDKKAAPVTQKVDPYNSGAKNSVYFATASLDLTTKVGSSSAIAQVMIYYTVPGKSNAEIEAAAKAINDGIPDGQTIKVKILGEASHNTTPIAGYLLSGNVSAVTGAWDYAYNGASDLEMSITRSGTKLQLSVTSPVAVSFNKRGGAGNPAYPGFDATTQFSLQFTP
jgi:hypothetical protein